MLEFECSRSEFCRTIKKRVMKIQNTRENAAVFHLNTRRQKFALSKYPQFKMFIHNHDPV